MFTELYEWIAEVYAEGSKTMRFEFRALGLLTATMCLVAGSLGIRAAQIGSPKLGSVAFNRDIRPILSDNCYGCHGPKKQEAEFRLDARDIALKGGELGPAVIPGKSGESLLIRLVAEAEPGKFMPKKGDRLSSENRHFVTGIDHGRIQQKQNDQPRT